MCTSVYTDSPDAASRGLTEVGSRRRNDVLVQNKRLVVVGTLTHTHIHIHIQIHRRRHRHRHRHTQTHRHTDTDTQTHRQTQTHRHRQTDTQTQTDRQTYGSLMILTREGGMEKQAADRSSSFSLTFPKPS